MRRQRGVALITAIFVVTLATIAAVAMLESSNISVHRSANLVQSETEWWYASGVESWVKGVLMQDAKLSAASGGNVVGLNGLWARPVDYLPIDGGAMRGHIDDLQGRFNLNNLATPSTGTANNNAATAPTPYTQQFENLLDNLPNFDGSKYHGISAAIRDWVDQDSERSGTDGAEDQDYQSQDPPYRAANQGMHSVSELLLVRGVTKELYAALLPYVTVLPWTGTPTALNINTAPEPVLLSLGTNVNRSGIEQFMAQRKLSPAKDASELNSLLGTQQPNANATQQPQLGVTSSYFGLQAEVFIGSGRLALYSVILRQGTGTPVVLAHSTNTQ